MTSAAAHELKEAPQKHTLLSLDKVGPDGVLEVGDAQIGVPKTVAVQQRLIHGSFAEQAILQGRSTFLSFQGCQVAPVVDQLLVGEPRGSAVKGRRDFVADLGNHRMGWVLVIIRGPACVLLVIGVRVCHRGVASLNQAPLPLEGGSLPVRD